MKHFSLAAGIALLAVSGAAVAQHAGPHRGERGADLSREQMIERVNRHFDRLDLDNDGRVTPEEMRQARQQMRGERQQRMQERLAQMTPEQRARIEERRAQWRERRGERSGERRGMRRGGAHMFGEQGFITREQMQQRALQRFDRMDLNRDGTVTAEERRQAWQQMREQRRERSQR
jgi:Ca2+-binding EF-hand superfamily protein